MPLLYCIAGEASGDMLGVGLMHELKSALPGVEFAGIGGAAMQQEGLKSLFPYEELAVMGFWEVVPHIPKFLGLLRNTKEDIAMRKPDAVITIDSPGFNMRLAKMLMEDPRTRHIKRIHYVAPSVWAYKPKRAGNAAQLFDLLLALLPFEPPYFEEEGLKTVFVGHPVLWQQKGGNGKAFRNRHAIGEHENVLLILPGSRLGEVKRHLPVFLKAAASMTGFRIVVLAGPQVKYAIQHALPSGVVIADFAEKQDAFAAATIALSKSGTITLELAAVGVPMVVAHKVSALSAWLIRRMLLIPYVSLVNIAAQKEIVPELMQEHCNAEEIAATLKSFAEPGKSEKQRQDVQASLESLRGRNVLNPSLMAARAVLETIKSELL